MGNHQVFKSVEFVSLAVCSKDVWSGSVLIKMTPSADKPSAGKPGKQVGDIFLVDEQTGSKNMISVIVSLGPPDKIDLEALRRAGGAVVRWMVKNDVESAAIDLDLIGALEIPGGLFALSEGIILGAFRFERHKTDFEHHEIPKIFLITKEDTSAVVAMLEMVNIIAGATNLARDWAHEPANVINPVTLADRVEKIAAQVGLDCMIVDDEQLNDMGAGAIVAVGKGSKTPSRLIILKYRGSDPSPENQPVAVVGKALTFDSGGYSLKDTTNIQHMKYDKCGGMAVVGVMVAAALLKTRTPLVGVIGAAQNMISEEAYLPDDIITTLSGKTVEIVSTDAEGRLVLADALTYVQKNFTPKAIIDLATLTGGVVVALGRVRAGIMSNNDGLTGKLLQAGETSFERLWRLPLDDDYLTLTKGEDADLKNSGGREGHAVLGGIFLKQFVNDQIPWAHLDIAGVADGTKELPYCPAGATGFGVRLILEYLRKLDENA